MITELQDVTLMPKISGVDLIAAEAKYHLLCMTNLRNRYRAHLASIRQQSCEKEDEKIKESQAFIELITHVENAIENGTLVFLLSELHDLYKQRLANLGIHKQMNRTRLKESLLENFPEAQEQNDGKNVVVVFKKAMQNLVKDAIAQNKRDFTDDAIILAKTAAIIRKDLFTHEGYMFNGSFSLQCQQKSVPASLKSLVSMILNGVDIENTETQDSQPCLTVCQSILFNAKGRSKGKTKTSQTRHTKAREPPLPLYIGFNIHATTRSKTLITKLYELGLSVSYQRILELETSIASSVSERFREDGYVVPACLRKGVFTVGALDNLDHNPSSTTASSSFHGTGISVFQLPTQTNLGEERPPLLLSTQSTNHTLPEEYAIVNPVELNTKNATVPACEMKQSTSTILTEEKDKELGWINHSFMKLDGESVSTEDKLTWEAYHASSVKEKNPPALTALLPLFYEKAATPAMVKHGMEVLKQATTFLNPNQIPVITLDQPLFAIVKMVQWKWPTSHGEQAYVVMMGGLHIEMALWNVMGDLLEGSGWTSALIESEVASSGVADSFLKAAHLKRTRHAHQVTLMALSKLKREAFALCTEERTLTTWEEERMKRSPTFFFWHLIMQYETLILLVVRAHRQRNFKLYIEALEELTPLFFALDHVNYARWIPIHIRDMKALPASIVKEFEDEGQWVLSKTGTSFSAMTFDQAHEQENKVVKSAGGAVGLTENPVAFRRWMLSGPEATRLLHQFESQYLLSVGDEEYGECPSHETGLSAQKTFKQQVNNLVEVVRRMGNTFLDDFPELVTLDNRDCMDEEVSNTIISLGQLGKDQYQEYVRAVIRDRTVSINNPIKKNKLPLYSKQPSHSKSKQSKTIAVLENNVALFAQLYVAVQSRNADLEEFFNHEVQQFPPSLSEFGNLRLPSAKSDLLQCIVNPQQPEPPSVFDSRICDGAVLVNALPVTGAITFNDYAEKIFIPYICRQNSKRIDIVWDAYLSDSLKESTREKRGKGVRRKVSGNTKLPSKWMVFLRDSANKEELFAFLTAKIAEHNWLEMKTIYVTSGSSVISIGSDKQMAECNHEEVDTRIVVHVVHAIEADLAKSVVVRTVDTDVVVILVGKFHYLKALQPALDLWVAFGTGRNYSCISINSICNRLGEARSKSLPLFHALSGCDTTSSIRGKSKKSAWQTWELYPQMTITLQFLADHPFYQVTETSEHFKRIERFTVIMFDKTSPLESINKIRMEMFCKNNRATDKLPPTKDALLQHSKRAILQAGIWTTSEQSLQDVPSPDQFSWKRQDGKWVPRWTTIPEVSKSCQELVRCKCKKKCTRCKCAKATLKCTPLCSCLCPSNLTSE